MAAIPIDWERLQDPVVTMRQLIARTRSRLWAVARIDAK